MSKIALLAGALALSMSVYAQQNIKSIEIGSKMPMGDLKMKTTGYYMKVARDRNVSLNDVKTNSGLLVMFSCNTCPYVVKSQARTKEIIAYAKKMGLGMIIVNSNEAKRDGDDSPKAMVKYAQAQGYDVPYAVDEDSKLADEFGATRTPEVFLFDGNGTLMYKGAMEDNPANPSESQEMYLKNAIDMIMSGVVPDPSSTKSIGCTIKRVS